jgi:hypothetical protein
LIVLFGLYLIPCILLTIFQRHLLYYPPRFNSQTYEQMGKRAGLERWQNSAGQNIGWKRLATAPPARGQILITYGNGGSAVGCQHYADTLQPSGWDVYILEYPGYADRPGSPSQANFFRAADEALALMPPERPTYLLGESLGTGVASYLAGTHPQSIQGVVLLAPYNRLADVAQAHYPAFPVKYLLLDRFNSASYLRNYHGLVAILTGTADRVVPEQFTLRLYADLGGPKKLWEIAGADHGDVFYHFAQKWPAVAAFWQSNQPAGNNARLPK